MEGNILNKRYAISDIHGNATPFLRLLDYVDPDPEELVICGDLGDRGLQSFEVYEECNQLLQEGATIVEGNHDTWLRECLTGKMTQQQFSHENIGGLTTLKSIDLAIKRIGEEKAGNIVSGVLNNMVNYHEDDNFIFVHAGLDPRVPYMDLQKREVLLMGCKEWSNPRNAHTFDQTIVFGHTPTYRIHKAITEEDARVWTSNKAKKIAIDTGAGFGWRLTMIDLWDGIAYAYDLESREIIEYRFRRRERFC